MSDLISRADAMGAVQDHFNDNGFKGYDDGQKMMDRIKALPSAEPKGDLISRADVLKYQIRLDHYDEVNGDRVFVYGVESVIEYVESLPSADAVQGEWIEIEDYNGDYHYQCSVCKDEFYLEYGTPKENGYAYCPSCGARMKGGDSE